MKANENLYFYARTHEASFQFDIGFLLSLFVYVEGRERDESA